MTAPSLSRLIFSIRHFLKLRLLNNQTSPSSSCRPIDEPLLTPEKWFFHTKAFILFHFSFGSVFEFHDSLSHIKPYSSMNSNKTIHE